MRRMKTAYLLLVTLGMAACGPSYGGQDVKTPEERLADEERLAEEDEKRKKERGTDESYSEEATDSEKRREFDKKQVKMELQRATRSAESCPGVVHEQEGKDKPRGETSVTITFQEDGTVKSVSIPSPFDGKPVGDCVIRAYKAVLVPPYTGGEMIVDQKVNLQDAAPAAKK